MIGGVTDLAGHLTAFHDLWLDHDGLDASTIGKALIVAPRRSLGDLLVDVVRFDVAYDALTASEGIETMLSLRQVLPNMPMIAALSAAHLAAILLPDTLRRLYIVRDNDTAGRRAAERLADRTRAHGIDCVLLRPHRKEFNDNLRDDGAKQLRAHIRSQLTPEDVARFMSSLA